MTRPQPAMHGHARHLIAAVVAIALTVSACASNDTNATSTPSDDVAVEATAARDIDHAEGYGVVPQSLLDDPSWRFYRRTDNGIDREGLGGQRVWAVSKNASADIIVTPSAPNAGAFAKARTIERDVTTTGFDLITGIWIPEGTDVPYPFGRLVLPSTVVFVDFRGDAAALRSFLTALQPVSETEWRSWIERLPTPVTR